MENIPSFQITVLGKTYTADSKDELKKLLKRSNIVMTAKLFNAGVNNKPIINYLVNEKTKEVIKLDLRDNIKPLLKKKFKILIKDSKKLKKLNYQQLNTDFKITSRIPKNSIVKVQIKITWIFTISEDRRKHIETVAYNGVNNKDDINDFVADRWGLYSQNLPIDELESTEISINSVYNDMPLEFRGMTLREQNILHIFNEGVENYKAPEGENCVKHYLQKKYKSLGVKKILKQYDEPTIADVLEICKVKQIPFKCYDITKKIQAEYKPHVNTKRVGKLNILAYNNHIYPINNSFLNKTPPKNLLVKVVEEIQNHLLEYLNKGYMPTFVSTRGDEVLYYLTDETAYITNNEYSTCLKIAKTFGISENVNYTTTLSTIGEMIENLYVKKNITSNWLNSNDFTKAGFLYHADIDEEELNVNATKVMTIDKNKQYSYCLKNLDYLVKVDYTKHRLITNFDKIEDHYLYIVKPEVSSLLLPNTNVYYGEILKYAQKEGLKFEILEGIETEKIDNYYTQMIEDVYRNCEEHDAKMIINRMIGKFQKGNQAPEEKLCFSKVCNGDESRRTEGWNKHIGDDWYVCYEKGFSKVKIGTKKPIGFQVLDKSRMMMYDKMKELGLCDEDIIKIKTDSISFYDKDIDYGLGSGFDDWKEEEYKYMKYVDTYDNEIPSFKTTIYNDNQITELNIGNAGCGKSHDIMHNLVPTLDDSYIILVPTNTTKAEYQKNNFNVRVKQYYTLNWCIPEEKNIIIDEIGMSSSEDFKMIIKCILSGKNIYGYGDFTQLLPVGYDYQLDNPLLMNALFKKQKKMNTNYRNNFKASFYDNLRFVYNTTECIQKVLKYNTPFTEADFIICYRNETVKMYNKKKMEFLGLNDITDIGCKVMLRSNDLRDMEIYNKNMFVVVEENDEFIQIKDHEKTYDIPREKFMKHFTAGYAMTLYCVQGESIPSYHYATEDLNFIDNRTAYTLISRLKTKTKRKVVA
jgi:hypothetical protein